MTKEDAKIRALIAQRAASLVFEHGIRDYSLAKRKASKQLHNADNRNLPSNEEIDQALHEYQNFLSPDASSHLTEALQQALKVMILFRAYNPRLTGLLAEGIVHPNSEIALILISDNTKEVELHLINQGIAYKKQDKRIVIKKITQALPRLSFNIDGYDIELTLMPELEARSLSSHTPTGKNVHYLKIDQVEEMIHKHAIV